MSRTIKKPYTKSKKIDKQCRNNGNCSWCRGARTYKNTKRLLGTLFMLIIITSCGTRKTYNQSTSFKSDSLSVENSRILSQNIVLNDIYTITPFDASKPIIIDGKTYSNVRINHDKSKKYSNKKKEIKKLNRVKKETETKNKVTEKKDNSNLWIGIVFVAGLLIIFYVRSGTFRL